MRIVAVLSIIGIMFLVGCSGSNTAAAGSADSDLEQAIRATLASDPRIQAADLSVGASVSKNEATLAGTLPSEELRLRAVELAKSARPNLRLTDKIDVTPPDLKPSETSRNEYTESMATKTREKAKALGDKIGQSLDDAWIYSKIVTRLAADPDTSALKVNVDVANKVVTLRGRVGSSVAKAQAERIAKQTKDVSSVKNVLAVEPAD